MRLALLGLRLSLAAVFLYAAYTKLRQPWLLFAMAIDAYQILPHWAVLTLARTLPWIELLIGLLLATGFGLRYASAGATLLLACSSRSWSGLLSKAWRSTAAVSGWAKRSARKRCCVTARCWCCRWLPPWLAMRTSRRQAARPNLATAPRTQLAG